MRYWVYVVDGVSREPREPLFVEAASEEDARAQAKELGMAVVEIEAVEPKVTTPSTPAPAPAPQDGQASDHSVARVLVTVFRVLAVVIEVLYIVLFGMTLQAVSQAKEMAERMGVQVELSGGAALVRIAVEGVLVVAALLAVAELLRLGMAIERNTRGGAALGQERAPR